jgi:metal-responsive CopG/Arc/MetJ family transcriptional regulator
MQTISIKIADSIIMRIDDNLEKYSYTTRSEFIRDAIRDKLNLLENERFETDVRDYLNNSPKNVEVAKTLTNKQQDLEKAKKDIFVELERKFEELREQLH